MRRRNAPTLNHEQEQEQARTRREFLAAVKGWSCLVLGHGIAGGLLGSAGCGGGYADQGYPDGYTEYDDASAGYCDNPYGDCQGGYFDYCDAYNDGPKYCDAPNPYSDAYVDSYSDGGGYIDKPNLYLYPATTTTVRVTVDPPFPGRVAKSDPEYGTGWNVTVEPGGRIDGKHGYLFYEAVTPARYPKARGWSIAQAEFTHFFDEILRAYGLNDRERLDFVEYWQASVPPSPFYDVHPLTDPTLLDQMARLRIEPAPDTVFRLWFVITPTERRNQVRRAEINRLERRGFTAVEWGVIVDWPRSAARRNA